MALKIKRSVEILGSVTIQDGTQATGKVLTSDANGLGVWSTPAAGVGGSGTLNTLAMWTPSGSVLGNSPVTYNGTDTLTYNVGANTPALRLNTTGVYARLSLNSSGTVDTFGFLAYDAINEGLHYNVPTARSHKFQVNTLSIAEVNANGLLLTAGKKVTTPLLQVTTTPTLGHVLTSDATGNATWQAIPAGLTGSGTFKTIAMWTPSGTVLGDSPIVWEGTIAGVLDMNVNSAHIKSTTTQSILGFSTSASTDAESSITFSKNGFFKLTTTSTQPIWMNSGTLIKLGVYNNGVAIGAVDTPGNQLEVITSVANTSGLRLRNLTSVSPAITGEPIGVDVNGDVVRIAETAQSNDWKILGNTGTIAGTNFVGTLDAQDLVFKTNNIDRGRFNTNGQFLTATAGTDALPAYSTSGAVGTGFRYRSTDMTASIAGVRVFQMEATGRITVMHNSQENMLLMGGNNTLTGSYNVVGGMFAGKLLSTGYGNIIFGYGSGQSFTTANRNVIIGFLTAAGGTIGGEFNTYIGATAASSATTGNYNTYIGAASGTSGTTAYSNTLIGFNAGYYNVIGHDNAFVGLSSGYLSTGNNNLAFGSEALYAATGNDNTAIGYRAAYNLSSGNGNIAIGNNVDLPISTGDNQININNLIYANTAQNLGIGISNPTAKLEVAGTFRTKGVTINMPSSATILDDSKGIIYDSALGEAVLKTIPNFFNTDLTQTAERSHNNAGFNTYINGTGAFLHGTPTGFGNFATKNSTTGRTALRVEGLSGRTFNVDFNGSGVTRSDIENFTFFDQTGTQIANVNNVGLTMSSGKKVTGIPTSGATGSDAISVTQADATYYKNAIEQSVTFSGAFLSGAGGSVTVTMTGVLSTDILDLKRTKNAASEINAYINILVRYDSPNTVRYVYANASALSQTTDEILTITALRR